ncbi:MAG: 2Fe-2S iron-sulfur cluster-binding protein [Burkholderiaceae bacterium]
MNRQVAVSFEFNGRRYTGFQGDTLASALLANGVRVIARSFKYHRPRGILAVGVEEPNAFVQVLSPQPEPLALATTLKLEPGLRAVSVNCYPGPRFDIGALLGVLHRLIPAGFYYKTFKSPGRGWPVYEPIIRRLAGLGVVRVSTSSPAQNNPDNTNNSKNDSGSQRQKFAHCDVLIVGCGPAGTAAALIAAQKGVRVIIADCQSIAGGSLPGECYAGPALSWIKRSHESIKQQDNVQYLTDTQVFGFYEHGFLTALQKNSPNNTCLWKIRARQVVLATGAIERPLVFPDNDRPGVMLASAALAYLNQYGVICGRRIVVFCNNNSAYHVAFQLHDQGIQIAAIVDTRSHLDPDVRSCAISRGIVIKPGSTIVRVSAWPILKAVGIAPISCVNGKQGMVGATEEFSCDLIAVSGGWNPSVHLHSQSGGQVRYNNRLACFVPGRTAQASHSAGASNGAFNVETCIDDGFRAGRDALVALGHKTKDFELSLSLQRPTEWAPHTPKADETKKTDKDTNATTNPDPLAIEPCWHLPNPRKHHGFVDFANDVTQDDLALALTEGYESVELVKRYTTAGMGPDQGRTANVNVIGLVADLTGRTPDQVGTTTFRPPFAPVSFGAIAPSSHTPLIRPIRQTPMTGWHVENDAVMYESGAGWQRPGYYPRAHESMATTVERECLAVRLKAGIYDSSPLGKIEICGPGADDFLDRVYTCRVSRLKPGRGRYGLMLREDGRLLDDGVVFKLGENHYWLSTTSGNADVVVAWLEYLRQVVWHAPVFITPVTGQWANTVVCGPLSRQIIEATGTDISLDVKAFPFMAMSYGNVADLPARVFRVSYTGELSYEINVPARNGRALWEALWSAGQSFGLQAIGSEANHVLRTEKGYISIGHEGDGMALPSDLGLDWAVDQTKSDFIGKRSLITDDPEPDAPKATHRPKLIGLLTTDPQQVLAEGAQIVSANGCSSEGFVTASMYSPTLGRSIALALLNDGKNRLDQLVLVTVQQDATVHRRNKANKEKTTKKFLNSNGLSLCQAKVCPPIFYDQNGSKLRG